MLRHTVRFRRVQSSIVYNISTAELREIPEADKFFTLSLWRSRILEHQQEPATVPCSAGKVADWCRGEAGKSMPEPL
ncbi:MAG: hypothetical protein IGS54_00750 [Elainella sp. C42_A2020_010]|nr:hypothetical protein [Elainella sp. C42_A2020_010]